MDISNLRRTTNDSYRIISTSSSLQIEEVTHSLENNVANSLESTQLDDLRNGEIGLWHYLQNICHHRRGSDKYVGLFILILISMVISLLFSTALLPTKITLPNSQFSSDKNLRDPYYVSSSFGAVASDTANCSALGAQILRRGGNAVDAAVTTTICVGVFHPMSSGIGGGCYILIHNASTHKNTFIDSRETAPEGSGPNMFGGNPQLSFRGGMAIATPAELKGLYHSWVKYGSGALTWYQLISPVAKIASKVIISEELALYIKKYYRQMDSSSLLPLLQRSDGSMKGAGDVLERPEFALTLQMVGTLDVLCCVDASIDRTSSRDLFIPGGSLWTRLYLRDLR